MNNFRFSLERYLGGNSRYVCPNPECGKKEFTRYIDNDTGEYIDETVGICNRIVNCGYHKTPKMFFSESNFTPNYYTIKRRASKRAETAISFVDEDLLLKSLQDENKRCNLFKFLINYFDQASVEYTFRKYLIGISQVWSRSTVFWQIDRNKNVRAGKIMQYDFETGRRDKYKISWLKDMSLGKEMQQIFFGIHLIDYFNDHKIGIVESEKTALICDLYFDEKIVWIASGGLLGITEEKIKDLLGREVVLFPDLSSKNSKNTAIKIWTDKAKKYADVYNINIQINQYLELISNDIQRENKEDLGDFILRNLSKI